MDPLSLIVAALAAGVAEASKDTVKDAVRGAYEIFKSLLHRRLALRLDAQQVLARYEEAPDAWGEQLRTELARSGAGEDASLVEAARAVLQATEAGEGRASRFDNRFSGTVQGVVQGDHNEVRMDFGARQPDEPHR